MTLKYDLKNITFNLKLWESIKNNFRISLIALALECGLFRISNFELPKFNSGTKQDDLYLKLSFYFITTTIVLGLKFFLLHALMGDYDDNK
jgi:hypothetical protein